MAIALTPFVALCGFRTPEEILEISERIPQFAESLGPESIQVLRSSNSETYKIRKCYEAIFQGNKSHSFLDLQNEMHSFFQQNLHQLQLSEAEVFLRIFESFPGTCKIYKQMCALMYMFT